MKKGVLYIVSTPIGNMEDITLRALRILKEANLILAEDTRRTKQLLNYYKISTSLNSYHQFSNKSKENYLVELIEQGKNMALVSDSGTPSISDPGIRIISKAIESGIKIVPIPGVTAVITALSVAGLPTHNFIFLGFLSSKAGARKKELEVLNELPYTLCFYESPHRLIEALKDMLEILGDRHIVICRELTKLYEEVIRGTISQTIDHFLKTKPRGEFCIIVNGK